jgi:hypothetical protein
MEALINKSKNERFTMKNKHISRLQNSWRNGSRLMTLLAVTAALTLGGSAFAQKKPGGGGGEPTPVPPGTIHFAQSTTISGYYADMTMKADGSGKAQIGISEQGKWLEPSHQLHGGQRWFLAILPTETEDPVTGGMREELFAVTENGQAVQVTDHPDWSLAWAGGALRWAKDDSFLSYVALGTSDESLFVADVDWTSGTPVIGAPRKVLDSGSNSGDPQLPALGAYDWSPSGVEMVYNDIRNWDRHEVRIARFLADGAVETRHVGYGLYPTWSPDGNWIAYGSQVEGAIWKIRPNGSGAVQLSTLQSGQQHTDQVWSPDSQHLAFTEYTRTTTTKKGVSTTTYTYDILRISANGGTATNLTTDTAARCWSIGWR